MGGHMTTGYLPLQYTI